MSKKLMLPLVLSVLAMALALSLWAAEPGSEEAAPAMSASQPATETVENEAGGCSEAAAEAAKIKSDLFNPEATPVGVTCNPPPGVANCQTLHGTACIQAGATQPCWFYPPQCEPSGCRCTSALTWKCYGVI